MTTRRLTDTKTAPGRMGRIRPGNRSRTLNQQRYRVTLFLMGGIFVMGGAVLIASVFLTGGHIDQVREVALVIVSPLMTLLGSSFAWLFANEQQASAATTAASPRDGGPHPSANPSTSHQVDVTDPKEPARVAPATTPEPDQPVP